MDARRDWQVTRWCCTSGLCRDCHARGNDGDLKRRMRIVQVDRLTQVRAELAAATWHGAYGAKAEPMSAGAGGTCP